MKSLQVMVTIRLDNGQSHQIAQVIVVDDDVQLDRVDYGLREHPIPDVREAEPVDLNGSAGRSATADRHGDCTPEAIDRAGGDVGLDVELGGLFYGVDQLEGWIADARRKAGVQRHAPAWVQSVQRAEIGRQEAVGWPDFHPEDFCHVCGQRNPVWNASPEEWATAAAVFAEGEGAIVCPACFTLAWEQATGRQRSIVWRLGVDPRAVALLLHEGRDDG